MRSIFSIILLFFVFNFTFAQQYVKNKKFISAYELQNKYEFAEAIDAYSVLLKKRKTKYEAYYNRGMCYLALDKTNLALDDFEIALKKFEDYVQLNHMIAATYMYLNDNANAVLYFEKAISYGLEPDAYIASHIGTCYYLNQQPDSAKKYLNIAVEINRHDVLSYTNLGWVYLEEGKYWKAKDMFDRSLAIDDTNPSHYNNLGLAYFRLGDIDQALELILKCKEMDEGNSFVYRNLALIYKAQGDKEKSCENYQKALDLNIIQQWGSKYVEELIDYCK